MNIFVSLSSLELFQIALSEEQAIRKRRQKIFEKIFNLEVKEIKEMTIDSK